jgi:hypothetical protein
MARAEPLRRPTPGDHRPSARSPSTQRCVETSAAVEAVVARRHATHELEHSVTHLWVVFESMLVIVPATPARRATRPARETIRRKLTG